MLLICNGWLGTALFLSFFAYLAWRYRREKTAYGMAGVLAIGLSFLYMFAYTAVTAPLEFIMIAVALLWRNDRWLRHEDRALNSGGTSSWPGKSVRRPASWATDAPPAPYGDERINRDGRRAANRAPGDGARGGLLNLLRRRPWPGPASTSSGRLAALAPWR